MSWNPLPYKGAFPEESLKVAGYNGFGYNFTFEELIELDRAKKQH